MKKTYLIITMMLFCTFNTTFAICTPPIAPTPKICYNTTTKEETVGQDSKYVYIDTIKTKTPYNYSDATSDIAYKMDKISYDICTRAEESRNNYSDSFSAPTPTATYMACPATFNKEDFDKIKLEVSEISAQINTENNDYLAKLNQLTDGTYPINANMQAQIDGVNNQLNQNIQKQQTSNANLTGGTTALMSIYGLTTSPSALGTIQATVNSGNSAVSNLQSQANYTISAMKLGYFSSQRKLEKLSYEIKHYTSQSKLLTLQKYLDCPIFGGNPDPSSCPIHSTLNSKNICACDSQFYPIFEDFSKEGIIKGTKNNTFLCGTKSAQMQSVGEYLYGSQVHYNLENNNYSCNTGYVFSSPDELKGKCILADTKNTSVSFTRTLKKGMSGDDVKQLQTSLQKLGYLSKTQTLSTYFGGITKTALVKLQKENNIKPANGVFSSSTQIIITSLTNSF